MTRDQVAVLLFEPGQDVTWLYEPRGGYGYVLRVPAVIVKVCKNRITINAAKADGRYVLRVVKPENLRPRPC